MPVDPRDDGHVETSVSNGIATVSFGHPKSNSLPGAILSRLAEHIERAGRDDAAQVVVLRSTGTGPFCAGASFDELKTIEDETTGRQFFSGFAHVILAMIRCPKFVIARVQGKAAGGGVGLIAAADWAIAIETAAVKLSELAVGIGPFVVGPVIERKIGRGAYAAMSVDAEWRPASWAFTAGLYAATVPSDTELDDALESKATWLSRANPDAMRELKRIFWEGTENWDELLQARAGLSGRLVLSAAAKAAIAAAGRR